MTLDPDDYEALCEALRPDVPATALADYLRRGAALPFAWGSCDCALWACAWVQERRGVDPLAAFRGTYEDEAGARRITEPHGGLANLMAAACALAGLERTGAPRLGDIGIVGTLLGPTAVIACEGRRWAGKGERGVWVLRAAPTMAWRV